MRFDLSAVKRFPIKGRVNFEFRAELLNAFNTPWFTPVLGNGNATVRLPGQPQPTPARAKSSLSGA